MWRDAGDLDAPGGEFHHHQHIIRDEPVPRGHLHHKEVGRSQDLPVHLQELCPTHTGFVALWSRLQVVAA
jgi:hypothetical protein